MLETLALTFALLVAGASVRACGAFLFKASNGHIGSWLKVHKSPLLKLEELKLRFPPYIAPEAGIARRVVQKAKFTEREEADLQAFHEAERRLNEARRALRSS